eukprot:gene4413-5169_t
MSTIGLTTYYFTRFLEYYDNNGHNEKFGHLLEFGERVDLDFGSRTYDVLLSHYIESKHGGRDLKRANEIVAKLLGSDTIMSNSHIHMVIQCFIDSNDMEHAVFFFEKIEEQYSRMYSWAFDAIINKLVATHKSDQAKEFFLRNISQEFLPFISSEGFRTFAASIVRKHGVARLSNMVDQLFDMKLITTIKIYNGLLSVMLQSHNPDLVRKLLNRVADGLGTALDYNADTYAICIKYYIKANNPEACSQWIDGMFAAKHIHVPDALYFMILRYFYRNNHLRGFNNTIRVMLESKSRYPLTNVFIYLDAIDPILPKRLKSGTTTYTKHPTTNMRDKLWSALNNHQVSKDHIKPSIFNQILQHYLIQGQYKLAMNYNDRRLVECQQVPNAFVIRSFLAYHTMRNEKEFITFWRNTARDLNTHVSEDDIAETITYFRTANKDIIQQFADFLEK